MLYIQIIIEKIFPIFLKKFRNANDLDFRIIHPEKPIDKSKIINYKFNPHFKRSISNKDFFRITNGLNDYTDKNNSLILSILHFLFLFY